MLGGMKRDDQGSESAVIGGSSGGDGSRSPPLFDLPAGGPGDVRVRVERLDGAHERVATGPHGHRFLELAFFERGGGRHRVGGRDWRVEAGDVFVIAPGEVHDVSALAPAAGWVVFFAADALGEDGPGTVFPLWHANPLLHLFTAASGARPRRFSVPPADRPRWTGLLGSLRRELVERRTGYQPAARAHLSLLLVEVARLAQDVPAALETRDERTLRAVFAAIDAGYRGRLSLAHVADAAGLTPGYLTTLVRERTGRTVGAWIAERRLAEARRLLVESDATVEAIADRVGFGDATHLIRVFRRAHGVTPAAWRRRQR